MILSLSFTKPLYQKIVTKCKSLTKKQVAFIGVASLLTVAYAFTRLQKNTQKGCSKGRFSNKGSPQKKADIVASSSLNLPSASVSQEPPPSVNEGSGAVKKSPKKYNIPLVSSSFSFNPSVIQVADKPEPLSLDSLYKQVINESEKIEIRKKAIEEMVNLYLKNYCDRFLLFDHGSKIREKLLLVFKDQRLPEKLREQALEAFAPQETLYKIGRKDQIQSLIQAFQEVSEPEWKGRALNCLSNLIKQATYLPNGNTYNFEEFFINELLSYINNSDTPVDFKHLALDCIKPYRDENNHVLSSIICNQKLEEAIRKHAFLPFNNPPESKDIQLVNQDGLKFCIRDKSLSIKKQRHKDLLISLSVLELEHWLKESVYTALLKTDIVSIPAKLEEAFSKNWLLFMENEKVNISSKKQAIQLVMRLRFHEDRNSLSVYRFLFSLLSKQENPSLKESINFSTLPLTSKNMIQGFIKVIAAPGIQLMHKEQVILNLSKQKLNEQQSLKLSNNIYKLLIALEKPEERQELLKCIHTIYYGFKKESFLKKFFGNTILCCLVASQSSSDLKDAAFSIFFSPSNYRENSLKTLLLSAELLKKNDLKEGWKEKLIENILSKKAYNSSLTQAMKTCLEKDDLSDDLKERIKAYLSTPPLGAITYIGNRMYRSVGA